MSLLRLFSQTPTTNPSPLTVTLTIGPPYNQTKIYTAQMSCSSRSYWLIDICCPRLTSAANRRTLLLLSIGGTEGRTARYSTFFMTLYLIYLNSYQVAYVCDGDLWGETGAWGQMYGQVSHLQGCRVPVLASTCVWMYGIDQRVRQPAPTAQVTARDPAGILMYDCVQSMSNSICLAWTELVSVLASSLYIKTRLTSLNMQGMSGL